MKPLYLVLVVIYCIICISLVVITLMQEGKNAGLGSLSGANTDTYWSKNKGRSAEGKLILATRILAALFIVLSIVLALKGWPHSV
ncbi:MAG: preprotein translocase subunit SecG [Lachnospiraceae bacterium]|nr:preprotein translocase subunit SecG [Lachnospiraceae bacterium]MBO4697503.1 preprotein translocase subunit SecG [Lachnospiraceae bacterium]